MHGRMVGTEMRVWVRVRVHHGFWRHWLGWVHGDGMEARIRHVDMRRHRAIGTIFRHGRRYRRSHGHDRPTIYIQSGGEGEEEHINRRESEDER